jgi:hypothetical protein
MSSTEVRAEARAVVDDSTWPAELAFLETFGETPEGGEPNPVTSNGWSSLDFQGEDASPIGVGASSLKRESGSITFALFRKSGAGDGAVAASAGEAVTLIWAWDWLAAGINLLRVSAPKFVSDDGNWIRFDLVADYERDHA